MNIPDQLIPVEEILQFITSYRALEQMPLEDGFAHLRAITPKLPLLDSQEAQEVKELRQHFRNHWYSKRQGFGQFYLNLSHYRQIYLLHLWNIKDWQDAEYLGTSLINPFFRIAGRPPAKALQLHQLVKYFENHGINPNQFPSIPMNDLPVFEKRFGNSANWGDYILSLPDPEPLLRVMIAYEGESNYGFDDSI